MAKRKNKKDDMVKEPTTTTMNGSTESNITEKGAIGNNGTESSITEKDATENSDITKVGIIQKKSTEKKKVTSDLPVVSLAIFCQLSGKRPDQIAGFRRYATNLNLKHFTIPEWREKLIAFQNKPMR